MKNGTLKTIQKKQVIFRAKKKPAKKPVKKTGEEARQEVTALYGHLGRPVRPHGADPEPGVEA